MKIVEMTWRALAVVALSVQLTGCATVDPRRDYERSANLIEQATGYSDVTPERDAAAAEERVEQLLRDGLTSAGAVEVALLNSPELQAAFREIGIARADLVQSGLFSNPTLGMAFRLPAGGGLTAIDLNIAQSIADLWQIAPRKRAAKQNLEQTILRIAYQASEVAARTKEAYFAALGAGLRAQIARENLDVARTSLELSEFRLEAGAGNALDVNLAKGSVLEARLAVERARLAASEARRTLADQMGLIVDAEELTLAGALGGGADLPATEALVAEALERRLDVRALRAAVQAADERFVLEYRRVFPRFTIGLSLERDVDRIVALGPSFALTLPIFDQNQAQIARARFILEQAAQRLIALETGIVQAVRSAADQARTARKIARFYEREVLPQARTNLDLAREAYRAGKTGILSVLDAERTFLAARDRNAAATEEAARAIARLELVIGAPLDDAPDDAATATERPEVD